MEADLSLAFLILTLEHSRVIVHVQTILMYIQVLAASVCMEKAARRRRR